MIESDFLDDDAAFQARLLDVGVVLGALAELVPQAGRHTPIGIFGHSNGGATAGEAMLQHPQIRAGVNLDGLIPGASFIPEIWQGHVNDGEGFWIALERLEQWF